MEIENAELTEGKTFSMRLPVNMNHNDYKIVLSFLKFAAKNARIKPKPREVFTELIKYPKSIRQYK